MEKPKSTKKTLNRALILHNYSFRNLEKYFSLRSKGGEARRAKELSTGRTFPLQRER
jgi:hypothetical protein